MKVIMYGQSLNIEEHLEKGIVRKGYIEIGGIKYHKGWKEDYHKLLLIKWMKQHPKIIKSFYRYAKVQWEELYDTNIKDAYNKTLFLYILNKGKVEVVKEIDKFVKLLKNNEQAIKDPSIIRIYTGMIQRYKESDAYDITLKSGDKSCSPDFKLLDDYKKGHITWCDYVIRFSLLFRMKSKTLDHIKILYRAYINKSIVLTCYCDSGIYCHRYIVKSYLRNLSCWIDFKNKCKLKSPICNRFIYCGELSAKDFKNVYLHDFAS